MENPIVQSPTRRRTRAQISSLIHSYYESGQTQQAFCREHGLSAGCFSGWLKRERSSSEGFVRASLVGVRHEGVRMHFQDGLELQLPSSWGTAQVAALIAQLQEGGRSC